MWGALIASILGGVLLVELLIARRKTQGKKEVQTRTQSQNKSVLSSWYVWLRPVVWVTLSSLLVGLPLIVQGAFVLTFSGVITGMFLSILIRAITNRLPAIENENQT
jgi:hypothetical protein